MEVGEKEKKARSSIVRSKEKECSCISSSSLMRILLRYMIKERHKGSLEADILIRNKEIKYGVREKLHTITYWCVSVRICLSDPFLPPCGQRMPWFFFYFFKICGRDWNQWKYTLFTQILNCRLCGTLQFEIWVGCFYFTSLAKVWDEFFCCFQ